MPETKTTQDTTQVGIRLPALSIRQLDQLVKQSGMNRTQVIIRAIDHLHEKEQKRAK